MVNLTISFTPALNGIKGELYYLYWDGNQYIYEYLLPLGPSENGVISVSVGSTSPSAIYAVVCPEQVIGGVKYKRAESYQFTLQSDTELKMTLIPEFKPSFGFVVPLLALGVGIFLIKNPFKS